MTINGLKYNSQLLEFFFSFKGEEGFNITHKCGCQRRVEHHAESSRRFPDYGDSR